jgi:signal transduction histidine kinase
MSSILSRIVLLHALALIGTALVLPIALYLFLSAEVRELQDQAFVEQADAIAQRLQIDAAGTWRLPLTPALEAQYSSAYGRYSYAILDQSGRVLFASKGDAQPVFPEAHRTASREALEVISREHDTAGVSMRKQVAGHDLWVQVAEDLSHRDVIVDDVVAGFFRNVAPVTAVILLLLLLADLYIFRRAIRPIVFAAEQVSRITPGRIDVRLSGEKLPGELQPLVASINQALDRLEQGFLRQRHFTETVAHELRTPLTILRTRIDMLADADAAQALRKDIEAMSRVVTQLLESAELETLSVPVSETADLQAVARTVVEALAPFAVMQKKSIALTGPEAPVRVHGNAELLERAVRNLAENAITHTGQGTEVEIEVGAEGTVRVLDRGPGIPEQDRELIFQRFWRGDRKKPGGAGLGLSIVKGIVQSAGGTIAVSNRPEGGAEFAATFVPVETSLPSPK